MSEANKTSTEEQKNVSKRNWADEEDDGAEDDDLEIGGSSVAKVGQQQPAESDNTDAAAEPQQRTFMPPKPRTKRERNIHGDFVVTKINIKEREIALPEPESGEEEEESSEESEEEQAPEEPEEEVKKGKSCSDAQPIAHSRVTQCHCCKRASHLSNLVLHFIEPVKILSKKEQKRLEDEEFERLMNEVGTKGSEAKAPKEESKQSAAQETQAEVDEKKRLANQKKKEKKKAKAAAAAAEKKDGQAEEMTEQQKQDAAKEAIKKRMAGKA